MSMELLDLWLLPSVILNALPLLQQLSLIATASPIGMVFYVISIVILLLLVLREELAPPMELIFVMLATLVPIVKSPFVVLPVLQELAPNTCSCNPNYYGPTCATFCDGSTCQTLCDPATTCDGHGTCSSSWTCICSSTYTGSNCSIPVCTQPCIQGTCTSPILVHAIQTIMDLLAKLSVMLQ